MANQDTDIINIIAANLRQRRLDRAMTLRELASLSGVSQRFLGSVEAGKANPSVGKIQAIAGALETTAAALLTPADRNQGTAQTRPDRGQMLALLGLRGAGKSTIGAQAAERLQLPFVELDQRITTQAGMSLEAIFSIHGSDYYRRLEESVLDQLLSDGHRGIVATGGSIVTSRRSYARLRSHCTTVFLKASAQDHWNRVVAQGDARPMANRSNAMDELRAMLRARRALYEQADHTLDTTALGLERSVDAVVRLARTQSPAAKGVMQ